MKKAYLAYPGLGKTTLSKLDDRFEDVETKIFKDLSLKKYIGKKDYPNYRGIKVESFNPEYPKNLQDYTSKLYEDGKILLLVYKQDSIDLLEALNIDYDIIFPSVDRLKLLENDYKNRGDSNEYIENNLNVRYKQALSEANNLKKEIFYLNENEYLEDLFKKLF